ncbi:monooxygenase [Longivirga aurantiaca]|uniref:Monooxygenase n=1 Tax=Longivirga aurantiaca TaxID=1837743 RepID=A0ABW1T200_9ACTN
MTTPEPRTPHGYSVRDGGSAREPVPAVVSLHLYGVRGRGIGSALVHMGLDRGRVRRMPGATFVKLLGTGDGTTFTMRDADLGHWGVLACWSDDDGPARYEASAAHRSWTGVAHEEARFLLRPLVSRGTWAGRQPFGDPVPDRWDGPVAAITRARIKPSQWRTFWGSVPPVSADLRQVDGLRVALGIGEAPVGLQGTFSVWDSGRAVTEFAQRRSPHLEVMRRTHETGWYSEELFARFAVVDARGAYDGTEITAS